MIDLLVKLFTGKREKPEDLRSVYGTVCSAVAICLNLVLAAAKFVMGSLAGSVAIAADAMNNLSDAGSSLLMLFGFRFAGREPDPDHPFGHGRIEYVTGLIVAGIILYAGIDAARSSVTRIFAPEAMEFSWAATAVLVLSILAKVWMALMYRSTGKKIGSQTLIMGGDDALNDTVSTSLALVCLLLYRFIGWNLDAWAGLIVAGLILKTGYEGARDTLAQLLGQKPDPELVEHVQEIVLSYPEVLGIHDMIIHDYGPGRCHVTVHAEIDGEGDIYAIHEAIDACMAELNRKLHCISVIHMDPIDTKNPLLEPYGSELAEILTGIDPGLSLHDLRVVPGPHNTNVIFDILAPQKFRLGDAELRAAVSGAFCAAHPDCACVMQIDRPFV